MKIKPQIIEHEGKPAFVVLPISQWEQILEAIEDSEDEAAVRRYRDESARGRVETYPAEVVYAVLDGANPVKAFREHREMTQAQLAKAAGIAPLYLSQIETGRRRGSLRVVRALAKALDVDLDLLTRD